MSTHSRSMPQRKNNRYMSAMQLLKKGMHLTNVSPLPVHPVKKNAPSNVIKKVLGEKTGGNLLNKLKGK